MIQFEPEGSGCLCAKLCKIYVYVFCVVEKGPQTNDQGFVSETSSTTEIVLSFRTRIQFFFLVWTLSFLQTAMFPSENE